MKKQNEFFANVFCRELNRWKKENHKTQENFAEAVNVEPNMISRYKKGIARPTDDRLTEICKVLCVDSSIFFPQTPEDHYHSDPEYRSAVNKLIDREEHITIAKTKIDPFFWEFLWEEISCMDAIFPLGTKGATHHVTRRLNDEFKLIFSDDIAFIEELQKNVIDYISILLLKKKLRIALDQEFYSNNTHDIAATVENVITGMVQVILSCASKEATDGNS